MDIKDDFLGRYKKSKLHAPLLVIMSIDGFNKKRYGDALPYWTKRLKEGYHVCVIEEKERPSVRVKLRVTPLQPPSPMYCFPLLLLPLS